MKVNEMSNEKFAAIKAIGILHQLTGKVKFSRVRAAFFWNYYDTPPKGYDDDLLGRSWSGWWPINHFPFSFQKAKTLNPETVILVNF